jgi:hypothetical protein
LIINEELSGSDKSSEAKTAERDVVEFRKGLEWVGGRSYPFEDVAEAPLGPFLNFSGRRGPTKHQPHFTTSKFFCLTSGSVVVNFEEIDLKTR